MKICMIVHNNGTRDGRVMREAHTLQAAGHQVTVLGVPEAGVNAPEEMLPDGVRVVRVRVDASRLKRLVDGIPRLVAFAVLATAVSYLFYTSIRQILALAGPTPPLSNSHASYRLLLSILIAGLILGAGYTATAVFGRKRSVIDENRRRQLISTPHAFSDGPFPAIRSRIPGWLPDWLLEILIEPFSWIGAAKFALYRSRSETLAAAAVRLAPDVVHSHDCVALPTGFRVKQALGIPLVYDAHEIYEAVAARKVGATDYFARVHDRYLPHTDGFVAVNDSAAAYYMRAYPDAPRATVIRNATNYAPGGAYDGRLHAAAGVPAGANILLYQGGFTRHRGLLPLVRSAPLLPENWTLVMMGSGPLLGELKAAGQGCGGKLQFLPPVAPHELLSWTQGATAGIVPYEDVVLNHWIATPNKLWEYPNAGVPMIVQPFPEMRRIVETYKCGWVLPAQITPGRIADLVASLTEEDVRSAREGCARFIAEDNWNSTYRPRLLQLYEGLEGLILRGDSSIRTPTLASAAAVR